MYIMYWRMWDMEYIYLLYHHFPPPVTEHAEVELLIVWFLSGGGLSIAYWLSKL